MKWMTYYLYHLKVTKRVYSCICASRSQRLVKMRGGSYSHMRFYSRSARSYSSAWRLKTWLRSRIGEEKFNDLAALNGHKQRTTVYS